MEDLNTTIYCLKDCNGTIFYIGKTKHPIERRLKQHIYDAKNNAWRVHLKIRQLEYKITIEPIVITTANYAGTLELLIIKDLEKWYHLENVNRLVMKSGQLGIYCGTPNERLKHNLDEKGKTITNS